ncbi:MAG: methylmalonyl-CoA carboxyltransferase [Solirubrobacteraceae bacterium]|nr:methylmalonyl-CoA carboxyltransferase [Solirubrobacteraceae bacterium]
MTLALVDRTEDRLDATQRMQALFDPGSSQRVRGGVRSSRIGERAIDGDGVVIGSGKVNGRAVTCFAEDAAFLGGSLGVAHADGIVHALQHAARAGVPVVGFVESAGARLQEGVDALDGYGRIFAQHVALSGRVPQISVVCGAAAGGGSYAPALTDFVIMTERASMFLTGPGVVREVMGEDVDFAGLGGPRVHGRESGVAHFVVETEVDGALLARDLLSYLPPHAGARPARAVSAPSPSERPDRAVPESGRKVYDVRHVIRDLVDEGEYLEVHEGWARNVVVAFARVDGHAVGIVANQPKHIGGVLDANASQKAARFVQTCDRFGVPLVVLVDTPGFLPGTNQERGGVIRHGAKLVHAFSAASVPTVTIVLRKAFGGALIAMNSKALGADAYFAWPQATLGVMGAPQAVGITNRREIAAADDPDAARATLAARYESEQLGADVAARDGHVDEVIAPSATRERISHVLDGFANSPRDVALAKNGPL